MSAMRRYSRRTVLKGAGATGLAALIGSCVDTSNVPESGPREIREGEFDIPDWAEAPTGDVSLRWVDSGDAKALYWNAMLEAYSEKFPRISVDYQGTNWNSIQEGITLGLRGGTAPDVFQLPGNITPAAAVAQGWLQPFDDVMPDFAALKERLPAGILADGVTNFDGKTYSLPIYQPAFARLLFINRTLAAESDIDVEQEWTLDSLGEAVRAVTTTGADEYYGILDHLGQPNGMNDACALLAQLSGMHGGVGNDIFASFNWTTGEFNYTDPTWIDVIDWYLGLVRDGCFLPGSISFDAPTARERFPQGQAVFFMQGPWNINLWRADYPDLDLGVAMLPMLDTASPGVITKEPGGGVNYGIAATSEHADVAGNILNFLFSDAGQAQWYAYCGSSDPAHFPPEEAADLDPVHAEVYEFMERYHRIGPSPVVRNQDVVKAVEVVVQPQPNLHDVCAALFTGEATDVRSEMQALQDRANRSLDEAVATARSEGANVSRDDFVFSDWVPSEPYSSLYE
ncbi:carbohydrate ABC transporter substrate-binding protein, CUT1 family [Jiangella alkaliphila]|uniref:Carbohydrate ABC transporter substrate-binding protein, CUT1 family n=1 Tax=Jiangella alkaliphila TaxID=419479 RepID=A0A1H2LFU1_9ACTN|nr:carbohydrate ABC transporter substrate-binding protein, CUT1 family [Jiangella alkaliphila]